MNVINTVIDRVEKTTLKFITAKNVHYIVCFFNLKSHIMLCPKLKTVCSESRCFRYCNVIVQPQHVRLSPWIGHGVLEV